MPRSLSGLDVGSFDDMDINGNIVVEGGATLGATLTGTSPGTVCTNLNLTDSSNSRLSPKPWRYFHNTTNELDCTHDDLNRVLTMLDVKKFRSKKKSDKIQLLMKQ